MLFSDRRDAGRRLAAQLGPLAAEDPVVVALPRGGVPVAFEIARALAAPLDILAVRKLGAPQNPELAVGAVAEDGTGVLDPAIAGAMGLDELSLRRILDQEAQELRRRVTAYRGGTPHIPLEGRTVIAVDDGLATGLTDLAAVRALRRAGASRIVVAAPVASRDAVDRIAREADEVVCVSIPHDFRGVGQWYRDFSPVPDEEVVSLLSATDGPRPATGASRLHFPAGAGAIAGDLVTPPGARGLVIFAHGSGSSRHSPRNQAVARALNDRGFATLLIDLLTDAEANDRARVFDVGLLAGRLEGVTRWARRRPEIAELPIGFFGASTGAAAALSAAADLGDVVGAVVSRGGRPDLAAGHLHLVTAPTLLVVGENDAEVLELNEHAASLLRAPHAVAVVPGAGHLFEEPGTLAAAAQLAGDWFERHLTAVPPAAAVG